MELLRLRILELEKILAQMDSLGVDKDVEEGLELQIQRLKRELNK